MIRKILAMMAFAVTFGAGAVSLDSLALQLAMKDPSVAAVKSNYDAEIENARAANTLAGPDVDFDYKIASDDGSNRRWGVSVGQSFEWPGVYGARKKANRYRAEAFGQLYRGELVDAAYRANVALSAASAAQLRLALLQDAYAHMCMFYESSEYAYSRGEITILEMKRVELERFSIAKRKAQAEVELETAKAAVRALNGGEDIAELPPLPEQTHLLPLAEYMQLFNEHDPMLGANAGLFRAAEADRSVARRSVLPSFKVAYVHDFEDDTHFNGFSVGVSLPSWNFRAQARAAEAKAVAGQLSAQEYVLKANAELTACHAKATRLNSLVDDGARAFGDDDYPALLRKALDMGMLNIRDYLVEYNRYLDAEADYIELREQLAQALAYINRYTLLP